MANLCPERVGFGFREIDRFIRWLSNSDGSGQQSEKQ
jgi:hypothetical protein